MGREAAHVTRRMFLRVASAAATELAWAGLSGCAVHPSGDVLVARDYSPLSLDRGAWRHDEANDIYYQVGVSYCLSPAAPDLESLGVYVPGAYLSARANVGGETYTCSINPDGSIGGYTAATAPVVMPIDTVGFGAQEAPSSYSAEGVVPYTSAGLVYVRAGCRGRASGTSGDGSHYDGGVPWGVTDLKAAVRYLRYNADSLPGSMDRIFTFGHSSGGAQSALMGATGDVRGYQVYLDAIGAVLTDRLGHDVSDAVAGAMCWCPITSLDVADEAYEWMMGQYVTNGVRSAGSFAKALSSDLANEFVTYVNLVGFVDGDDNVLSLAAGGEGSFCSGSYYDHLLSVIEGSLNNFLAITAFPYAPDPTGSGVTYDTAEDYVASLNGADPWIRYDSATNRASIASVGAFVRHRKAVTKGVGAFDMLDRSAKENQLFGDHDSDARHFDATMAGLLNRNASSYASLSGWDEAYPSSFASDLANADALGTSMAERENLYNPLYYLCGSYEGYGTSTPAKYWRIRTGIEQGDTSLTTEVNLALALRANDSVEDVDFATVWGVGHSMAERTGSGTENFIAWVRRCTS